MFSSIVKTLARKLGFLIRGNICLWIVIIVYMIQLEPGANTFYLIVEESRTIANAEYVFVFVSDLTNKKVACACSGDLTDDFWTQFDVTVQASGDPLNSKIALDHLGSYKYFVYERSPADILTFDYAGIDSVDLRTLTGLVTEGKMQYSTTPANNNSYKDTQGSIKAYGD